MYQKFVSGQGCRRFLQISEDFGRDLPQVSDRRETPITHLCGKSRPCEDAVPLITYAEKTGLSVEEIEKMKAMSPKPK